MDKIQQKIKQLKKFQDDRAEIMFSTMVANREIIIDFIVEEQLYERGIRGDGVKIWTVEPYKPATIEIKEMKGQPTDRITLRDTGDFHASVHLVKEPGGLRITADDWKTGHLIEKYGEQIFWLLPENLNDIIWNYIYPELLTQFKKYI